MRKPEMMAALIRGGIAPRRALRLVSEFETHREDLTRERLALGDDPAAARRQADVQLGNSRDFVVRVLDQPGLKSLAWRHPWLAYALLPLVGFGMALVLSVLALMGVGALIAAWSGPLSAQTAAARWLAAGAPVYICWVAPALAGSLLARWAIARRAGGVWPWIGIVAIALAGASTNFGINLPPQVPEAQFAGGIGWRLLPSVETCGRLVATCLCALALRSCARRGLDDLLG